MHTAQKRQGDGLRRLWTGLFFALLLGLGLWATPGYGLPCDERTEQVILQENLMEYALQLQGADSEAAAYYQAQGIQRISQSVERDHGQCAYYLAAPLLSLAARQPHTMTVLWHSYTWLWFMAGVWALYAMGRELGWSRPVALACCLLLYVSPRFFAEGHYNSKDMVLLSLVLLCLWLGLRFIKKPGLARGLLFSLAGAMATNTKIAGAIGWGLMGLCALACVTARRQWSWPVARLAALTVAAFGVFYALLTPALWPDPLGYLSHAITNASGFTRWPGVVLYRGLMYDQQLSPLPRSYLPVMMGLTLPLYTLPLAGVGQLWTLRACWRSRATLWREPHLLTLVSASLCWLLPLGYALLARPLVYNGWRHFYFTFAGLAVLGGQGIWALGQALDRRPRLRRASAVLLALCFGVSALGIASNHPYQYAYYNPLASSPLEEELELDYWVVSTQNAMEHLVALTPVEERPLVLGHLDAMSEVGLAYTYPVLPQKTQEALLLADGEEAPYLFVNTTYGHIYGVQAPPGYQLLFTLEGYGHTLCRVYQQVAE